MSTTRRRLASSASVAAPNSTQQQVNTDVSEDETDEAMVDGAWSPATGKKRKLICKGGKQVCGKLVVGTNCIRCDGCRYWFHPRCQELSVEAFAAISKYGFIWLCQECKPCLIVMLETGKILDARIAEAERKIMGAIEDVKPSSDVVKDIGTRIQTIEKSFAELKDQQNRVEATIREQKQVVQEMPKVSQDLKSSADQLKKFVQSKDKEGREANVILHNIPESNSQDNEARKKYDTESFFNVADALLGDVVGIEIESVFRLGKKPEAPGDGNQELNSKPRLMMVKLKSKSTVDELIKKRTHLKDVGFPNVYVTRDLSPEERAVQRVLREELNQKGRDTHVIFRGKVIPRN